MSPCQRRTTVAKSRVAKKKMGNNAAEKRAGLAFFFCGCKRSNLSTNEGAKVRCFFDFANYFFNFF
jgi:hypothetical protein